MGVDEGDVGLDAQAVERLGQELELLVIRNVDAAGIGRRDIQERRDLIRKVRPLGPRPPGAARPSPRRC
jgi:hypothetical protein